MGLLGWMGLFVFGLQPWVGLFGAALVFVWDVVLCGILVYIFRQCFVSVGGIFFFFFWGGSGRWVIILLSFVLFLIFPNFLRS